MKKIKIILYPSSILVFLLVLTASVFPFTDQTTSERILKENKHFVHFINICVTNFGEKKIDSFRSAYQKHFSADVAYLQADYRRAYKRIYSSQGLMADIYSDIVKDYYLEDSKNILDKIAPIVIRAKNARARLFLTLGYRDRTVSWTYFTIGEASNPKLRSYRIYKYMKAIKMARRAKRYGFLALFESQNSKIKKKIYHQMIRKENENGNPFYKRFVDLPEDGFIKEMGKNYDEYERESKQKGEAKIKRSDPTFENRVQKRVRFRNEKRAARYILNTEYDQAEDIMRSIIDDFNFKLITATFEVLNKNESENKSRRKINFNSFKVHLMDNYSRLTKDSVLDELLRQVRVEDEVDEEQIEQDNIEKKDTKKVDQKQEKASTMRE